MTSHGTRRQPGLSPADIVASGLSVVVLVLGVVLENDPSVAFRVAGVFSAAAALLFAFPPMFTLKRHGRVEEGGTYMHTTRVVDAGLFAIVRHPQYVGYSFFNLTFMCLTGRLVVVALGVAAIAFFYAHTYREERYLLETFGDDYRAYRRRVPRFNFLLGYLRHRRRPTDPDDAMQPPSPTDRNRRGEER